VKRQKDDFLNITHNIKKATIIIKKNKPSSDINPVSTKFDVIISCFAENSSGMQRRSSDRVLRDVSVDRTAFVFSIK